MLLPQILYSDNALLVLNGTSLNIVNARNVLFLHFVKLFSVKCLMKCCGFLYIDIFNLFLVSEWLRTLSFAT